MTSHAYRNLASLLFLLTALAQILDAITTAIGLSIGGTEMNPTALALMKAIGFDGFALVKVAIAIVYAVLGIRARAWWTGARPWYCFVVLIFVGVSWIVFTIPVVLNFLTLFAVFWNI